MSARGRRLAAVGAAAAVAVAVAACGQSGDSGRIQLTMTVWGGELDQQTYTERLELAEQEFPEIDLRLEHVAEGYDQRLQTRVAGGTSPDIMQLAETVNVYSSRNQLVDLQPYFDEAGIDVDERFGEASASIFRTDEGTWAAPDRAGAMVLYYNTDLFDEAGIDYPTADWTWEQFRDAASELTIRDGEEVQQYGFAAGSWWPWWLTFMTQNGGGLLDSSGAPVVNSAANVEALEFYQDLVYEDRSAPSPRDYANLGLENSQADPLFVQGRLAMVATGFWSVGAYDAVEELNWDIAPMFQGAQQATPAFFSGLAVSAASDHPDEAAAVVAFLTGPEGQAPIAVNGEDVPANLEVASSPDFLEPAWLRSDVNLGAFAESAEFSYVPPLVPEWSEIQAAFGDSMDPVWTNEATVQAGLDAAQSEIERLLSDS